MFAYHDDFYEIPGDTTATIAPSAVTVETGHNPSPNVTWTSVLSRQDLLRGALLGLLRQGPRRSADRRRAAGQAALPRPRHRRDHRRHLLLVRRGEREDGLQRQGLALRGQVHGRQPRLQVRRPVQQRGQRLRARAQRLHLHLRRRARLRLHPAPLPPGRAHAEPGRVPGRHDPRRLAAVRQRRRCATTTARPISPSSASSTARGTRPASSPPPWTRSSPGTRSRRGSASTGSSRGDGKTVLKAHCGRYYRGVVTGEFDNTSPSDHPALPLLRHLRRGGEPRGPRARLRQHEPARGSGLQAALHRPVHGRHRARADEEPRPLRQLRVQDAASATAATRTSAANTFPTSTSTAKATGATGAAIPVQSYVGGDRVFQLTNPDGMFSRFNGVTVQLVKRMADNWQMTSSFVWGRSTGRVGLQPAEHVRHVRARGQPDLHRRVVRAQPERLREHRRAAHRRPPDHLQDPARLPVPGRVPGRRQLHLPGRPAVRAPGPHQRRRRASRPPSMRSARRQPHGAEPVPPRPAPAEGVQAGRHRERAFFADVLNALNDDAYEDVQDRLGTSENFGLPHRIHLPRGG